MFQVTIKEVLTVPDKENVYQRLYEKGDEVKYGYVAAPEGKTKQVEVARFNQTVDTLDITAVIRAVNGL